MFPPRDKGDWLALLLLGISVAAIIAGLVLTGGPGRGRAERQDQARLDALYATAVALNCYYRGEGALPDDLEAVKPALLNPDSPARKADGCWDAKWRDDPFTNKPFEVERVSDDTLRLCTVFERPSPHTAQIGFATPSDMINTGEPRPAAGRHCYEVNLRAGQVPSVP